MQSEGVAADIATRCAFVQRVEHIIVYWMRELLEVEGMYCWSVIDGQPVVGMGRMHATLSIEEVFVEVGTRDGVGVEQSALGEG